MPKFFIIVNVGYVPDAEVKVADLVLSTPAVKHEENKFDFSVSYTLNMNILA